MLNKISQLSEATEKTKTGIKHTAEPGGYGRKDDEDEEGNKVKNTSAEKKGRGRPKKATSTSGETKKYDFSAFGVKTGKDIKLPAHDKKKTTKHSIKEYIDQLERALNEGEQIEIKPATQTNTQVIQQGNKTLGTVSNPQLAAQIKAAIGKNEMSLAGGELGEGDIGKHNNATTGFDALVRKLTPKYGVEAAKRIAGAQLKKIKEADMPPNDSLMSPISEARAKADDKAEKAGKKVTKDLEYDMGHKGKDDKKAEKAGKKVTKDIEYDEKKKKIKEGMEHKLKAARHRGKAHALAKESYNCKYDDMEEARHYHEGFKEGLDECYGMMPVQGLVVGETTPPATVPGMASQAMHEPTMEDDMYEMDKTAYMKQQAMKTPGDTFKAFGQTFKDKEVVESPFAFEALEQQLNSLLESKEEVAEGMTVSISKGQQGSPDSVTVSAQDGEADQLLSVIKQAGLGLFGGEETNGYGAPQGDAPQHGGVDVVGDHDGMMALIKKVTGGEAGSEDYADEESHDDHGHDEPCDTCGSSDCECDADEPEMVDEVESEDQMEYEVAEEIDPNNSDEANEVNSDAVRDAALATAASTNEEEVNEDEDEAEAENAEVELNEWANEAGKDGTETSFEQDIDFMTKVISGGLNKQKSTGQSTIPVVSTQLNRLGNPMQESVDLLHDWKKLSGIK